MAFKIHIATSRDVGERCKAALDTPLYSMEECDIFISILYENLISEEFIRSKKACFNFHPGILPQYRGAGAYSWVLINKEKETGVTLHYIDNKIDHGDIIDIEKFNIQEDDTAQTLFLRAESTIFYMFLKWFKRLEALEVTGVPQDHAQARLYLRKDLKEAQDLTHYVRALTFKGKPNAFYLDKQGNKYELLWENQ